MISCVGCEKKFYEGNFNRGRAHVCKACRPEYRRIYARLRRKGFDAASAANKARTVLRYTRTPGERDANIALAKPPAVTS